MDTKKWAEMMAVPIRLPHDVYPVLKLISVKSPNYQELRDGLSKLNRFKYDHVDVYECKTGDHWLFDCLARCGEHENFLLHAQDLSPEQADLVAEELSDRLAKIRLESKEE
jgi:hypothetical protein